ncbi:ribosome biogenesis factor YjgA [Ramlibacter sp.]|uniref:ribosome biogenesis factor YjgA n=1 Tax=Ramlibacter sp. TaxID=1917967 RepID=UPI002C3C080D|nr:ribosome biogenesis factor YjgA [Ramlibacter sp.]HWI84429.1 ribosome biogenesis factor YjgA [Ramlibacter sp.]
MPRKPKKGYFVRGQFIAEGSPEDLELKAQLKGGDEPSKTDLKRESAQLQKTGEALLTLRGDLMQRLQLPEKLVEALGEARRITNFEGKRRQMQFVGKLMRGLDEDTLQAIRAALDEQQQGSAGEALALHRAEQWRDRLIESEEALGPWLRAYPATDTQQLRALIRQARKDPPPDADAAAKGQAPRHGRAYRDIFQLVREQLTRADAAHDEADSTAQDSDEH